MTKATITRAPKGEARRKVKVDSVQVPDLWHIAMWLQDNEKKIDIHNHLRGQSFSEAVLECWHLCHDLLENIKNPDC